MMNDPEDHVKEVVKNILSSIVWKRTEAEYFIVEKMKNPSLMMTILNFVCEYAVVNIVPSFSKHFHDMPIQLKKEIIKRLEKLTTLEPLINSTLSVRVLIEILKTMPRPYPTMTKRIIAILLKVNPSLVEKDVAFYLSDKQISKNELVGPLSAESASSSAPLLISKPELTHYSPLFFSASSKYESEESNGLLISFKKR
jgi:hypothetical protein